jgi:K+-transporting ATPase KdpF subunit
LLAGYSPRLVIGSNMFDYILAGAAALFLLIYLLYALLKPERF